MNLVARLGARAGPGDLPGAVHQLLEALVVDGEPLLREQLLRHLVWKAVGVVELERVLRGHPGRALLARGVHQLGQQPLSLSERAPEALLLGPRPALDGRPLAVQLGVGLAHRLDGALGEPHEEARLDPEHASLVHRPAHDPAQDVPAVLVRGHHAVAEQEGGRPPVVREDAQRAGGLLVLAVPAARQLLPKVHERPELVGLEDRLHPLEDRRHAVEPHAGVDVPARQRRERAVVTQLVLHEHEVPVLEEALRVVPGPVVVGAELRSAVQIELRAGPARPGRPRLPEVVLAAEAHDPLVRHADRAPALDRLLVRSDPELFVAAEDRDPDPLEGEPEALGRQFERQFHGALLEVVAHREVPQHLEEREVAMRAAHLLDVGGAEHLLAGGETPRRGLLLAAEVRLEGLHAGGGEQHGRVV